MVLAKDYFGSLLNGAYDVDRVLGTAFGALSDSPLYRTSYNVYRKKGDSEDTFFIEVFLAGFSKEKVSVSVEDRHLVIVAEPPEVHKDRVYIGKGHLTPRAEVRYLIGDEVVVKGATFVDGVLTVELHKPKPKAKRTVIPIS